MTDNEPTTDDRILEALRHREKIVLTAGELAEQAGAHRTTVLDHLHDMEDEGRVASIEVGAKGLGWYLPGDTGANTPNQYIIPTYHEYVRRPVDKRGRVTIGSEYAHKSLTLAVLDSPSVISVEPGEWSYKTPLEYQRVAEMFDDEADDRGRVQLGSDWREQEISIAVLEVKD